MSLPRHDPRRDANERTVVDALQRAGALVYRLSAKDLPDLLVGFRGRWHLLEVKVGRGKLSAGQRMFFERASAWDLPCAEVRTVEDAFRAVGLATLGRGP